MLSRLSYFWIIVILAALAVTGADLASAHAHSGLVLTVADDGPEVAGSPGVADHQSAQHQHTGGAPHQHQGNQSGPGCCFGISCSGPAAMPLPTLLSPMAEGGAELSWLEQALRDTVVPPLRRPPRLIG